MSDPVEDYITANSRHFTREAIRARLVEAGHDGAEVDRVWDRMRQEQSVSGLVTWAKVLYGLGLLGMGLGACAALGLAQYYFDTGTAVAASAVAVGGFAAIGWLVVVATRKLATGARAEGLAGCLAFAGVAIAMFVVFAGACLASTAFLG